LTFELFTKDTILYYREIQRWGIDSVLEKKGFTILRKVENGVITTDKDGE
jgi:hypothetical protein